MKLFIHILLIFLALLVVGCQDESKETRLINQAEGLLDTYPDSVIITLDSIFLPEETASDYLILADIEKKCGNLNQAEYYLQKVENIPTQNTFIPASLSYYTI